MPPSALQDVDDAFTGPSSRVHSGSLLFMLTATFEKHDAPLPHAHWYACTSK